MTTHDSPVRFGRYELVKLLARGGMAEIYLGTQRVEGGMTRKVVIKKILPHLGSDPHFVAMFMDEAQIAMRLSHPNIAHTIDFGKEGDDHYIVLEYVDGISLRELLRRAGGKLPVGVAARIVASVAAALAHAHATEDDHGQRLGIVHRDVSPQNVLVARDGTVKLIDFGIARARSQVHETEVGSMKGKFAYMAPEQFQGGAIDGRTDLFSLSILLWEALAGERLFRAETATETMRLVCADTRPSVRALRPEVDPDLEAIVRKGLESRPEDRWQDAESFVMALEEHMVRASVASSTLHVAQFVRLVEHDPVATASEPAPGPEIHSEKTALASSATESSTPMGVERTTTDAARPSFATRPSRALLAAVGIGSVAGLIAAAIVLMLRQPTPPPPSLPAVAAALPSPIPSPSPGPTPSPSTSPSPSRSPTPSPSPTPTPSSEVPAPSTSTSMSPSPQRPAATTRAPGRLFINTRPWSKVYLRGRLLGTTPLGNVEVPSGAQRFTFETEDGARLNRTIYVRPDGTTKAFVQLR